MNAEQIKRCAEAIRQHGGSIEEIIAHHVAAAKESENDVAWLRAYIRCFTEGEDQARIRRIANRLERDDK